jgi:uncharacterized protein YdiU (UPF0061 family)
VFARRVLETDEVDAWKVVGEEDWEEKRRQEMIGVNPRFVLRQWVLEEVIADMEKLGTEGINEARVKLNNILEVNCAGLAG